MCMQLRCVLMYLLTESRTLPTLGAKNKKVAELWKEFSTEQKETYKQKASTTSVGSSDNCMTAKNLKGESKKICSYLQDLVGSHLLRHCTENICICAHKPYIVLLK